MKDRLPSCLPEDDFRRRLPRFQQDALRANLAIVGRVREIAERAGITPAQVAPEWVVAQGEHLIPIPVCVGLLPALEMSVGVVRAGGTISRVGAPQYDQVPLGFPEFLSNITLTGGVAPARAYIDELLPDVLDGKIEPGRVFNRTVGLDEVPDGYRAMADREALKVLVQP